MTHSVLTFVNCVYGSLCMACDEGLERLWRVWHSLDEVEWKLHRENVGNPRRRDEIYTLDT